MASPSRNPLGASRLLYLREWRDHRDLTQEQLGAKVGLTQGMISQLEGGANFTKEHLELLSGALGCSVRDLMFRRPDEAETLEGVVESIDEDARGHALEILKTFRKTTN